MSTLWGTLVVVVVGVLIAGPAVAGGWAVASLDSVARPVAGQTVEVGFTIRQHGVSPVDPGDDVGIVIRSEAGVNQFFAAESDGEIGHYVAEVTFPEEGAWTWGVRQGWFGEQDLGPIDVAPPEPTTALAGNGGVHDYRWPTLLRVGLPAIAVALGGFAIADVLVARRRRTAAA